MHGLDVIDWRMLGICTYVKCISQDSHLHIALLILTVLLKNRQKAEAAGLVS